MMKRAELLQIPDELVMNKIYVIRNQKVMLDRDLAELYGVESKQLKRQVSRTDNNTKNIEVVFQGYKIATLLILN
jgi:hypothetical protein